MSCVTGIMLVTYLMDGDEAPIVAINSWLAQENCGPLKPVEEHAGGSKHPQFSALCAGYNYFRSVEEFVDLVLWQDWNFPENVVLAIQPEDGPLLVYRPPIIPSSK